MDIEKVLEWVRGYERAWREVDLDAVETLFTEQAHYRASPYEPDIVGHDAIKRFWPEDEDGTDFTMSAQPIAVQERSAVVRVLVNYRGAKPQEYRDLWVLRFAADGRVEDFEEWAYWPGKPYTAG